MATAAEVPDRYDLVIGDKGYVFLDGAKENGWGNPSVSSTPTFVPRQNVQGDYGDSQTEFFQTFTQRDWSKGDQARYEARGDEPQSKYWRGSYLDVRVPGQVTLRKSVTVNTWASAPRTGVGGGPTSDMVYVADSTNLRRIDYAGAMTSEGAHGLGAAPSRFGIANAGDGIYLSTTTAGTVGVRRWSGSAFSTFSATASDSLAYLNNALYGYSNGILRRYDTAGVATSLFTWQGAIGTALSPTHVKLVPFGGKLLILRDRFQQGAELWLYDGTAPAKIAEFPANFLAYECAILNGTVFVSGAFEKHISATVYQRPAVFYYANGTQDLLWQADDYLAASGTASLPAMAVFDEGLVWVDNYVGQVVYYDARNGGTSGFAGSLGGANASPVLLSASTFFHICGTNGVATAGHVYPAATAIANGDLYHSLADFDSSLTKLFRGIKVEFQSASDGNGGSVDIAYRVGDVDGSYTTLQTGAVSGTEYTLTNITGSRISVKLTINKGTSTDGPKLKRLNVRAAPFQPSFRRGVYPLNLGGYNQHQPVSTVKLRDGTDCPRTGLEMAQELRTIINAQTTHQITDVFGTYTGVADVENCNFNYVRAHGEFAGTLVFREV